MRARRGPAELAELLEDDILEEVALRLCLKDRVVFLSSSRVLAALAARSQRLWAEVDVEELELCQVHRLGRWLHARRLQLGALGIRSGCRDPRFTGELMWLLGLLAGSSLHTLELDWRGPAALGGWLGALPHLRSLEVTAQYISVSPQLSEATSLTRLYLNPDDPLDLPPEALPPHLAALTALELCANPLAPLEATTACTGGGLPPPPPPPPLRELHVCFWDAGMQEGALRRLSVFTDITSLRLYRTGLRRIPQELAVLTSLCSLELSFGAVDLEEAGEADWAPILSLRQLSFLNLKSSNVKTIPTSILCLPELKELDLSGNPFQSQPLPLAAASQLRALTLGIRQAARSAGQLPGLLSLRTLTLEPPYSGVPSPEEMEALLRGLGRLPSLQVLSLGAVDPGVFAGSQGVVRAFAALMQQRPGLKLEF